MIQTYDGPNSYQPFGTLEQGIPAAVIPDLGNGLVPLPNQYVTTTINQQSFKRGYIQSWNFTVQKELPWNLVVQAGYVATRSTDQLGYLDLNAGQIPGLGIAGQPLYQKFGRTAATTYITPMGTDQYNSLQAKVERRFAKGFQLGANYTWAKSVGPAANDDTAPRVSALQYFYLNRAVLPYDRTQVLNLTGAWELPFGKGKPWLSNGLGAAIAGNWRINGISSFMSGLPFSVSASGASLNMPSNTQRADQVKPSVQILGGVGPGQSYFDPFAFAPVTQPRFGNAGYYSMRGPGAVNVDLAIGRDFPIKERFRLQFRAEAFNASNTPHFALPGANVSNLVLNNDNTIRNLAGYTQILSTQNLGRDFDERHIQFDLRFSF